MFITELFNKFVQKPCGNQGCGGIEGKDVNISFPGHNRKENENDRKPNDRHQDILYLCPSFFGKQVYSNTRDKDAPWYKINGEIYEVIIKWVFVSKRAGKYWDILPEKNLVRVLR